MIREHVLISCRRAASQGASCALAIAKETYHIANETYHIAKETYHIARETYHIAKETYHIAKKTYHIAKDRAHLALLLAFDKRTHSIVREHIL